MAETFTRWDVTEHLRTREDARRKRMEKYVVP